LTVSDVSNAIWIYANYDQILWAEFVYEVGHISERTQPHWFILQFVQAYL